MMESDHIFIRGQRVSCHIGVADEERAQPQELLIHTTITPRSTTAGLEDDIAKTVDYHAIYTRVEEVAKSHSRKLIETLAEDLAGMVLSEFAVDSVSIEIEKFILPKAASVGVSILRARED